MHNLVLYVSEYEKFPSRCNFFLTETQALYWYLFVLLIAVLQGLSLPLHTFSLEFSGRLKNTIL